MATETKDISKRKKDLYCKELNHSSYNEIILRYLMLSVRPFTAFSNISKWSLFYSLITI